ncbi:PilW family protein [Paraburkholderia flava]|uniref:PilW family protein n=1 Tax=Paraburkholderia flava TaxID=2547393 RepID=UPI00106097B2|nr:PilW family protein [Paraburkholderia flava]
MTRSIRVSRGHTLIELMIAVTLGLVVVAGAVSLYRSQRAAFVQAADAARIHDSGIAALSLLAAQVRMAGFTPAQLPPGEAIAGVFGCSGARAVGDDDQLRCESLATHSDGLRVRYVGDTVSTWMSADGRATDCLGQGVDSDVDGSDDAPHASIFNSFYIKTGSTTGEPELYCEGSGHAGFAQPLVEGIERLRIHYWLSGAQGALDASAIARSQWPQVVAVDLCVLVHGAPLGRRMRYIDCDDAMVMPADTRARQAFWRRVAIRNQEGSGR